MLEILAPAGSPEALDAALAAGADAVYFGLKKLNARRGAANFTPEALPATVERIHAAGAKAYLTLNIQIAQRELGLAFRTLKCAEDAHVDAVLVTDPALLAVVPHFPGLSFHFSTQAAVSSSAGVRAAQALGLTRVVLARELSATEIAACTACGTEIETFVQGAHCFSCSGRCLLSSWGGGRSGNRGACTSPCRVHWTNREGVTASPLSMHDLSLLPDLPELQRLGVASLKIEGRLKSAQWVSEAVSLYRHALQPNTDADALQAAARHLGDYTGRQLSNAFFHGCRDGLTGESARPSAATPDGRPAAEAACDCAANDAEDDTPRLKLTVTLDERDALCWHFQHGAAQDELRIPRQRIANPRRAVYVREIADAIALAVPKGELPALCTFGSDDLPDRLLPKNARNSLLDFTARFYRLKDKETDGVVRDVTLPPAVTALLAAAPSPSPANTLTLGSHHTHLRLDAAQLDTFAPTASERLIVNVAPQTEDEALALAKSLLAYSPQIDAVALPEVIYEAQIPPLERLLTLLDGTPFQLEVNSWDTWQLARSHANPLCAGPGLAVLNAAAAVQLEKLGCRCVTVSPEIDHEQLEDLARAASTPLALTVFAHLKLMTTRAILPAGFQPADHTVIEDSRHTRLRPETDGPVTILRSVLPLDWRDLRNPAVKVSRLVIDLAGCRSFPPRSAQGSTFNYDRRLR